jgi:bacterial/archaeal transporter family protein
LTSSWLVPTIAYTIALGALGVTGKLALRTLDWPQMVIWAAIAYACVAVFLLVTGKGELIWAANTGWALLSGAIVVGSLVLLYVALGNGDASKVIPITAAYPAVTLVLAAIFLSEEISAARIGGMALVLVGVVVLTVAD